MILSYSGGLVWIQEWNSLQHSLGASFLATLYSHYMDATQKTQISCNATRITANDLRKFAASQVGSTNYELPIYPVYMHAVNISNTQPNWYVVIVRTKTLHGIRLTNQWYEIESDGTAVVHLRLTA